MAIADYPIASVPIAGEPVPKAPTLPTFPPISATTRWNPAASGAGTVFANGNRLARTVGGSAICDVSRSVDHASEVVAEIDYEIDPSGGYGPVYFGLATASADTSLLPGSDANSWAVKLEYIDQVSDESRFEISYRHNGINTYLGDYLINNDPPAPVLFFCVVKTGQGNIQAQVGTSEDDTWPTQFPVDVDTGTDNLQAGDDIYIVLGNQDELTYLNGDNPAGFVNADDLYPAGVAWDDAGEEGVRVATYHDQPIQFAVPTNIHHAQPLSDTGVYDHAQPIKYAPVVGANNRQPVVLAAGIDHLQPVGFGTALARDHAQPIGYGNITVVKNHRQPWKNILVIGNRQPVEFGHVVDKRHAQPIIDGAKVYKNHAQPVESLDIIPVFKTHRQPAPVYGEATTIVNDTLNIVVGGKQVDLLSASVRADNGSPFWHASIALASPVDYGRFPADMPFTLNMYGTAYAMITDTRQLSRGLSPAGQPSDSAAITGLSVAALLGSPRAKTISRTWESNISAKAAAEDAVGQPIDWRAIDWIIPAYRLAVQNAAPLAVVQQLAAAVGALVLSKPDGALTVVPEYPAPSNAFAGAPVSATLGETVIFASAETIASDRIVNKIRIIDIEATYADRLEFEADEVNPLRGTVRAYPSPWTTAVTFRDTAGMPVRVYPGSIEERQETETIEIMEGRGSVGYPIQSIQSVEYIRAHLGSIAFEPGTVELITDVIGWSLLEITYTTRSIAALAEADITTKAQILLERIT